MKRFTVMLGVLLFAGFLGHVHGQPTATSEHIFVTFAKTTHLIFPFPIQSVDHGNNGIIVQKREGAGNILHVKAAKEKFEPTSLSVVTSDGAFYSFIVQYATDVVQINHAFTPSEESVLQKVIDAKAFLHRQQIGEQIRLVLHGIYTDGQLTWLKWNVDNQSLHHFDVSYCKYFIRDKKLLKRSAVNERELLPTYYSGNDLIEANNSELLVTGFTGIHVKRREQLQMQIGDASGQMITMKVPGRLFRKARQLK